MTIEALVAPCAVDSQGGPLTAQHHRELAIARGRAKSIYNAARVAFFNGWATAIVALLSAPFALFSVSGALVFIGLAAVTYNEFRGRKRLLQFDRRAATLLGWNQLGLLAIITVYCLWAIKTNLNQATSVTTELQAYSQLETALGSVEELGVLARQITVVFYGSVISMSVVFQGLNALYYFTRRKYIEAYTTNTPEWIRQLHATTTAV